MALEYTVEDQVVEGERGLERIADDVVEIEAGEAFTFGETVRMDHHERAEFFGFCPKRSEIRIGKLPSSDIRKDLDTLQSESAHQPIEFRNCFLAVCHRYAAETDKTVRLSCDIFGNAVVKDTGRLDTDLKRNGVIALKRRRHHELNIDAHLIKVD